MPYSLIMKKYHIHGDSSVGNTLRKFNFTREKGAIKWKREGVISYFIDQKMKQAKKKGEKTQIMTNGEHVEQCGSLRPGWGKL